MARRFSNPRHITFTKNDLLTEGDTVTCKAGQFTQVGAVKMPAGIAKGLGFGDGNIATATARAYADPQTDLAAAIDGTFKFSIMDESFSHKTDIGEVHTRNLRTTATDLTKQMAFPYTRKAVTQDKYLRIEFMPDGTGDVIMSKTNSTIYLSGTKWTVEVA